MRARIVTGATGPSGWLPVDYYQSPFGVGMQLTVGGGTAPSLTYKLQHGFSNGVHDTEILITRSTTTATVVFKAVNGLDDAAWVNHGLAVADNLQITGAGAPLDGTYAVASIVDSRTVTYTVANSGALVNAAGAAVQRIYVGDHPVVTGVTGATGANYAYPVNMVRTNITTYGAGSLTLSVNQGVST